MMVARAVAGLHPPPEQGHCLGGGFGHRTFDGHRKIKARRSQLTVVRVIQVVEHIDAAAKHQPLIDHAQLAVQPAPLLGAHQVQAAPGARERCIHLPMHTGSGQPLLPGGLQRRGADPVHQHLHRHAAAGGAHQGLRHLGAGAVEVKNIGFQLDPINGRIHSADQGGEKGLAALQQHRRV